MSSNLESLSWAIALGLLFQVDVAHTRLREVTEDSEDLETATPEIADAAIKLAAQTVGYRDRIDRLIRDQLVNYELGRLPAIERNILRLAVSQIIRGQDSSADSLVRLAANLADQYGGDQSARFVTGVLKGILEKQGARSREQEAGSKK